MRSADTNVLVRLYAEAGSAQSIAAGNFVRDGVWISKLVLAETAWVLTTTYKTRRARLAAMIEELLNHERHWVEQPAVVAAALAWFRAMPPLSFTDCLLLESARAAGHLPFGTFDRRLAKLPGATLIE